MIPESVRNAWQQLPENKRVTICRACAKKQPFIFSRWSEAAGLKNFRHESLVNRKAGSASRLDAALFQAEGGHLAADLLVAYFTEMAPQINEQYLELLEKAGNEELETKLNIYAALANEHRTSPFIQLYLATALWVGDLEEKELATIEKLAAAAE